jgi:lipopolysaccharide export LptBFGC system permease protein LptF
MVDSISEKLSLPETIHTELRASLSSNDARTANWRGIPAVFFAVLMGVAGMFVASRGERLYALLGGVGLGGLLGYLLGMILSGLAGSLTKQVGRK